MAENRDAENIDPQHMTGSGVGASPCRSEGHVASPPLIVDATGSPIYPPGYLPPLAPLRGQAMSGPGQPAVWFLEVVQAVASNPRLLPH